MRHILIIEYEYCRVYLNSLALQAVVERCASSTPPVAKAELSGHEALSLDARATGERIPSSTVIKWRGDDQRYIKEVVDASRSVLRAVVEGLRPGDYLRHAPVRTWFRIISVAIILLKVCAPNVP